jgi:hypothetical protein
MTQQRRSGFRLPWAGADEETDPTHAGEQQAAVTEADAKADAPQAAVTEARADTPEAKTTGEPALTAPADATSASTAAASSAPTAAASANPFLRSLVEAMRGVAEEARATSLSELKAKVEQRVEHLGATGAELAEDLRRQSELDIKGIGDWERGEVERIRGEAARKVEARRQQLEQQLVERQQQTEHEIEATRGRLAEYERELATFVAELAEIDDPGAFVEAASRMPRQPALEVASAAGVKPAASTAESVQGATTLSDRLAKLGDADELKTTADGSDAAADAAKAPTTATAAGASNRQHAATDEAANTTTAIVVKGLGSFGAITSFKQALEKSGGIRAVSLSLGPTGEFVYRATHDPSFDIEAAIREAESGAASIERQTDGTVRVNVVRAR